MQILRFPSWSVRHGFSTREGGVSPAPYASLNLGASVGDDPERVRLNRAWFLSALDSKGPVFVGGQVHGAEVRWIEELPPPGQRGAAGTPVAGGITADHGFFLVPGTDGLLCRTPGALLWGGAADCGLVFFQEPKRGLAGMVHAGWRGTLAGIVERAARMMVRDGKADFREIRAGLSPSIGPCCYEVQEDVAGPFRERWPGSIVERQGKRFLDLRVAHRAQLRAAGVPAANVSELPDCTACRSDLYFSHRRDGSPSGRMAGAIGL